jgi:hypothetical protein
MLIVNHLPARRFLLPLARALGELAPSGREIRATPRVTLTVFDLRFPPRKYLTRTRLASDRKTRTRRPLASQHPVYDSEALREEARTSLPAIPSPLTEQGIAGPADPTSESGSEADAMIPAGDAPGID